MQTSRRGFLARTLALGCSAAASPLITPVTFASAPGDNRLVVIILRGGMDGLHAVAPIGDRLLSEYRPALLKAEFADLDGYFALPPELGDLLPMWRAGDVGFAHAVSTPYRDKRSHFDGQDLLEAGVEVVNSNVRDSGWLNRMLTLIPGTRQETAFSVGHEDMLLLRGPAPKTSWSPEGRVDLSPQAQLLLNAIYEKDPLFAQAGATAMALTEKMRLPAADPNADEEDMADMSEIMQSMEEAQAAQGAKSLAAFTAGRLREETRIASFSIGGWDTHQKQLRSMRKAMTELAAALTTLKAELGPVWGRTTVLCLTEFGRTARQNGSRGTDHGTGSALVMAGGGIRGGRVYGKWPGIRDRDLYARRDLMPTRDVRAYPGWAMHHLFGIDRRSVETVVFPGLDLGRDPGFLA